MQQARWGEGLELWGQGWQPLNRPQEPILDSRFPFSPSSIQQNSNLDRYNDRDEKCASVNPLHSLLLANKRHRISELLPHLATGIVLLLSLFCCIWCKSLEPSSWFLSPVLFRMVSWQIASAVIAYIVWLIQGLETHGERTTWAWK